MSELGMDIQCGSAAGSMVSRKNDHSYFTDDRDIVNMTYEYIRILSIAYFLASYFVILNGYIRGTGNTVLPMFSSVFGYWAARLPAAYVLKEIAGYMGICLAIPAGWIGSCIIVRFYIHSKKFTVFMKRQEEAEYERTDRKIRQYIEAEIQESVETEQNKYLRILKKQIHTIWNG